jgi:hypothetical protein
VVYRKSLLSGRLQPSLACKYLTKVEVNGSGKHTSLVFYGDSYGSKSFILEDMAAQICDLKAVLICWLILRDTQLRFRTTAATIIK